MDKQDINSAELNEQELKWLTSCHIGDIIKCEKLTSALTNQVFLLTSRSLQQFIFKRLNQQARDLLDRKSELVLQKIASDNGLTPQVINSCKHYKLQEYVAGSTLSVSVVDKLLITQLAEQLQIIHQLPMTAGITTQRLEYELLQLKKNLKNSVDDIAFNHYLNLAKTLDKNSTRDIICHGDLSLNNLLKTPDKKIKILDWEYGVIGCSAYDLAFCSCINALDSKQHRQLVEDYYRLSKKELSVSDSTLEKETNLYLSFFRYLNTLWALFFVDV